MLSDAARALVTPSRTGTRVRFDYRTDPLLIRELREGGYIEPAPRSDPYYQEGLYIITRKGARAGNGHEA